MGGSLSTFRVPRLRERENHLTFTARLPAKVHDVDRGHIHEISLAVAGVRIEWAGFTLWLGGRSTTICDPSTGYTANAQGWAGLGPGGSAYFMAQLLLPDGTYDLPYNAHGFDCAAYKDFGEMAPERSEEVVVVVDLWTETTDWLELVSDTRCPFSVDNAVYAGSTEPGVEAVPPEANPASLDGIPMQTAFFGEAQVPGGAFGWSVEIVGGNSTAGEGTLAGDAGGAPDPLMGRPGVRLILSAGDELDCTGRVETMQVCGGQPVNFTYFDKSFFDAGAAGSVAGDDLGNLTLTALGTITPTAMLLSATCEPDRVLRADWLVTRGYEAQYSEDVRLRTRGVGYDGALLNLARGRYDQLVRQIWQEGEWTFCAGGEVQVITLPTGRTDSWLLAWLDDEWLRETVREDPYGWRCSFADYFPYHPLVLDHAAEFVIDDLSSSSGWSYVSGSGGIAGGSELTITPAAGGSAVSKAYTPKVNATEYRYVRFSAKADSNRALTLNLDGHTWEVVGGLTTSYAHYEFDLCAPQNSAAFFDRTDSSYVAPGDFYGAIELETVTLQDLENGATYYVKDLEFVRGADRALRTAQPPLLENFLGDDNYRRWRLMWGLSDGRQILDFPHRVRDENLPTEEERDEDEHYLSVAELAALMNDRSGLSATFDPPASPTAMEEFYYADGHVDYGSREAYWQASEWYPSGTRTNLLDVGVDPDEKAVHLLRFDAVRFTPGFGDPAGDWGLTIPVRFTKRLQDFVHGLAIDAPNMRGDAGAKVEIQDAGNTKQTLVSDAAGYFRSAPFARLRGSDWEIGSEDSGMIALDTSGLSDHEQLTDRKFRSVGLAQGTPASNGPVLAASVQGWLHVGRGPRVRTYNIVDMSLAFDSADHPVEEWLAFRRDDRRGAMWLLGDAGSGTLTVYTSQDGGITITEVLSLTANSMVIHEDSERGLLLVFYGDADDAIWLRQGDVDGFAAAIAVDYGGSQLTGTLRSITRDVRRSNLLALAIDQSGSTKVLQSRDAGESFSLLLS